MSAPSMKKRRRRNMMSIMGMRFGLVYSEVPEPFLADMSQSPFGQSAYRAPPASFWASGDRFRERISPIWLFTRRRMSLILFFMKKNADRNTIEMNRPIVVFTSDSYTPFARSPGVGAFRVSMTWKEAIMPV